MPSHVQIALVADDLTGALDATAPFANAGLRCVVATTPADLAAALLLGAAVVAVSTNSRELPPDQAAAGMAAVAAMLSNVPVVFKKIDSRLKGPVAAEVAALAQARGLCKALVCPAIPDMGRVVIQGQLRGFGVARPLPVGAVFADHPALTVLVPEACTDADIDGMLAAAPPDALPVGARGLAAGLARRMAETAAAAIALPLPQPIGFAIGSRDPITLAQVGALRHSQPQAVYLAAPNGRYGGPAAPAALVILQAVAGAVAADPADVTAALATTFVRAVARDRACLVLTGGETAAAVLAEMRIGLLQVLGEALPGLPLCRALDFPLAPLIVAKSGGFGAPDALALLVQPPSPAARQTHDQG